MASSRGGFYVLLRLPEGSAKTGDGVGGGSGLGFVADGGCPGWMTADGQNWVKVGRSYGFAVVPQFVAREPWMMEKSSGQTDGEGKQPPRVYKTALLPAAPNPFNPATDIRFSLKSDAVVDVSIFDLRGRRVIDLVREQYPAGEHAVHWEGRDGRGHGVASSVYFVRFRADGVESTQRITLIR